MPEPPPHLERPPAAPAPDSRPARYRSLRDLSREAETHGNGQGHLPGTQTVPVRTLGGSFPPPLPGMPLAGERPRRRSAVRTTVLVALAILLTGGVGWGGYLAYKFLAPYYGRGYVTGGTAAVSDVTFTVTEARCGLTAAPDKPAQPVKGKFCVVEVNAANTSGKPRYLSLSQFSVKLDTGSPVPPSPSAMPVLSVKLDAGDATELQLVYDMLDGARMATLKVQVSYETATIPLV